MKMNEMKKKNDWKENPKYIQACCDFILGGVVVFKN